MMEVYTSVMRSNNYDMFKFMEGNRKINSSNLNQIIVSMREKQLIIPITVNEKFEIIDGQHRFSACKYLGLPVYFIIEKGYNIEDVIRANVNGGRKWFDDDYLNKYCLLKDDRYLEIKKIKDDFNISTNDFIKILSIIQGKKMPLVKREFREGKINLDGMQLLINFLMSLETFKDFKHYKNGNFVVAFSRLFFREDYDHEYMTKKYKTYYPNLTKQTYIDEYLSVLCNKIYSYGTTKNPIYYSSESKKFHQ